MCLIVDNNVVAVVLLEKSAAHYAPVRDAIAARRAKLVYGGLLAEEYVRNGKLRSYLVELDRGGQAIKVPAAEVEAAQLRVPGRPTRRSDDPHVLGLALASGARLLCTEDADLIGDFCDHRIISGPRGKVITKPLGAENKAPMHANLVRNHCSKCKRCVPSP